MKRSSNLEIMRFAAAILVIFSHSFTLIQGTSEKEWLVLATNAQLTFGSLAVAMFFLCGGFFTVSEIKKINCVKQYITKRLKRIIPMLAVVTFACVVMGAFVSELGVREYLCNKGTYIYLLNSFMILIHDLPGVFTGAPYASTVNGALWTLPLEFVCNLVCVIAYKMGLVKKKTILYLAPAVAIIAGGLWWCSTAIPLLGSVVLPCLLFFVGAFYNIYFEEIKLDGKISAICGVVLVVTAIFGGLFWAMLICFPYLMFWLWFEAKQIDTRVARIGKLSYPIYLCGFPIQQLFGYIDGWKSPWYVNAMLSIPTAVIIGGAVYYLCCGRRAK